VKLTKDIFMAGKLIPGTWETYRLIVSDSLHEESDELQHIHDMVPQTRSWMLDGNHPDANPTILDAMELGVLPPLPTRSKENFRIQTIRLKESGKIMGFLAVYHGFPQKDVFWINALTLEPDCQGKGFGPEILGELFELVKKTNAFSRIQTFVSLTNWPSLRLCAKAGLNQMLEIVGDKVHTDNAEAHVKMEKVIKETSRDG